LERERSYEVPFTILVPPSLDPYVELYEEMKEGFCEQLSSIAMTCSLMHNIVIKKKIAKQVNMQMHPYLKLDCCFEIANGFLNWV